MRRTVLLLACSGHVSYGYRLRSALKPTRGVRMSAASASPKKMRMSAASGLPCSLRACVDSISPEAARVEVAVHVGTEQLPSDGCVDWVDGQVMAFHKGCWEKALTQGAASKPAEQRLLRVAYASAEKFDSVDEMQAKAQRAAEILRGCQRAICFTGAGISTAAGLGDYRGNRGKWTLEAQGSDLPYTTEYEALRPTFAHEAITKLMEMGHVAYVASQNADGLHHLSGIPYGKLSDVHGSAFTEYCPKCGERYVRDTYVPEDRAEDYFAGRLSGPMPPHIKKCPGCGSNHWTGRKCDKCSGPLHDTVISFGDGLEDCVLRPAFENARRADACLSLGSTMSIGPSNQVVAMHRGPLIACVRQDTEMDFLCERTGGVRAYGDCDDFMRHLMKAMLSDDFSKWEESLILKQEMYNKQRPTAGKQRGDIFVKKF